MFSNVIEVNPALLVYKIKIILQNIQPFHFCNNCLNRCFCNKRYVSFQVAQERRCTSLKSFSLYLWPVWPPLAASMAEFQLASYMTQMHTTMSPTTSATQTTPILMTQPSPTWILAFLHHQGQPHGLLLTLSEEIPTLFQAVLRVSSHVTCILLRYLLCEATFHHQDHLVSIFVYKFYKTCDFN